MTQTTERYHPGLEGIIAGETRVSAVEQDDLAYFGYRIEDLAEQSTFEEVAYLLLHGELPGKDQLAAFMARVDGLRPLPEPVIDVIRRVPRAVEGMDVLRSAVSMLGHFCPAPGMELDALRTQAMHVLAAVPGIIAARLRTLDGKEPLAPKPGLTHAGQFLYQAFGRDPDPISVKLIDLTMILYAEHEFNASAFACRVTASTLSDLYSGMVTGISTLKGPLHGGANEDSMKMINRFKSGADARAWAEQAIANKEKISGFGHRVYKNGDHRARILEPKMKELARQRGEAWRLDVYDAIKGAMWDRKKIHMNVDYPCGLTYFLLGLPLDVYTPLFVASRVTGWSAHFIEQALNNKLIRPLSRYTGPPLRAYVPLDKRKN